MIRYVRQCVLSLNHFVLIEILIETMTLRDPGLSSSIGNGEDC